MTDSSFARAGRIWKWRLAGMHTSDWMRLQEVLFSQAIRFRETAQRNRFLAIHCRRSPRLRDSVQRLIEQHHSQAGLLESSARSLLDGVDETRRATLLTRRHRYQVVESLGEGGMGTVYLARRADFHQRPDGNSTECAVKIARHSFYNSKSAACLFAERQALARLNHPFIVRFLDAGVTAGERPFLVMERVRGKAIDQACDESRLNVYARLRIMIHVCDAAIHAHRCGISHRDIKPSNVLLTRVNQRLVPKLIDFGIWRPTRDCSSSLASRAVTAEGIGTPSYMSPERLAENETTIDMRCDVYSLGALLYELISGVPPMSYEPSFSMSRTRLTRFARFIQPVPLGAQLRRTEPARLNMLSDGYHGDEETLIDLWRDLDRLAMRCLAKSPSERFATVHELQDGLRQMSRHSQRLGISHSGRCDSQAETS